MSVHLANTAKAVQYISAYTTYCLIHFFQNSMLNDLVNIKFVSQKRTASNPVVISNFLNNYLYIPCN